MKTQLSKVALRKEITALRNQVAAMEKNMAKREEKLVLLIETLEPFFPLIAKVPEARQALERKFGLTFDLEEQGND